MNTNNYNTNPNVILLNKTGADTRFFEAEIYAAVRGDGVLPEEIADLFDLEIVTRPDGSRYGVLTFA